MFDEIERLPPTFIMHAAEVLGATSGGLNGSDIAKLLRGYSMQYGVDIPHGVYPLVAPNKRTALFENLQQFSAPQQHRIIREMCEHVTGLGPDRDDVRQLKVALATRYSKYDSDAAAAAVNDALVKDTRHWLDLYPDSLSVYNEAIDKFRSRVFERNILDDLRLSLELLLEGIFNNNRSLENQLPALGQFIKQRGGSSELANMFSKLVEYYTRYQNTYVKHADDVIEEEIEFIMEITSAFMKHLVRMNRQQR
jgi:hypothetical protein